MQSEGGEHRKRAAGTAVDVVLMLLAEQAEFNASVEQGFQASPTWHQGSILAAEAGAAGPKMSTGTACQYRVGHAHLLSSALHHLLQTEHVSISIEVE